jgi:hypothetical protein
MPLRTDRRGMEKQERQEEEEAEELFWFLEPSSKKLVGFTGWELAVPVSGQI